MLELFSSTEFIFGAIILGAFQLAKFNEFSAIDETVAERSSLIPNLKASDFASRISFRVASVVFVGVTFIVYFLVCSASPTLITGWAEVTGQGDISDFTKSVSYPLFIAAAFMGLTQKGIPGLSKIADLQRSAFHNWLGVPKKVIDTSIFFSDQLLARTEQNINLDERLTQKLTLLTSYGWRTKLGEYADTEFFKRQVERMRLDEKTELNDVLQGSNREKTRLIEQLIFSAAIATVRKSGGRALARLANDLDVVMPRDNSPAKAIFFGILLYLFVLTVLIFFIPMLEPFIAKIAPTGKTVFWPKDLTNSTQFLTAQIIPVLISVLLLLAFWPKGRPKFSLHDNNSHFFYLERYAPPLLTVMFSVVVFDYLQAIFDYGYFDHAFSGSGFDFFIDMLPFHLLHSLVSLTICTVVLIRIEFKLKVGKTGGMWRTWMFLFGFVLFASGFYATARLTYQFDGFPKFDYILLMVILNLISAAMALITAMSHFQRQIDAQKDPLPAAAPPSADALPAE